MKKNVLSQRYFIQLSYNGANYHGWQKQENAVTVQETVEKALSVFFRIPIEVTGAGRTDTGVHARFFIAHFDIPEFIINIEDCIYHLNGLLPSDIAIQNIVPVISSAHARFDAISRTYEYQAILHKDPFEKEFCYKLNSAPDLLKLSDSCQLLLKYTDYTSFCKLHSNNVTNICKIYEAYWRNENNKYIFKIKADRFLRDMVRTIVGTMLDVGYGKMGVSDFKKIIEIKNRGKAGMSVPAHGLYLVNIEYPQNIYT